MRLVATLLAFALSGCITATATARGAFSVKYACADEKVTTLDLGPPVRGVDVHVVEVTGCGQTAKYTCAYFYDCLDEPARGSFTATDDTIHATSPDAGLASAAHDLACDAKNVTRVSDAIYEGCGQRATYQVVYADGATPRRYVLTGRVALDH